ncbi:hypothetical protein F4779DRAFT_616468 [Xylariaceae sp. FL0662B]|nr:hypothetical protein F4779DRAFT_616468 [Xylariaceae sp. FL0662B]
MPEICIRTTPSGRRQFVRAHSFSHHHSHHHRHHHRERCFDDCAGVSVEQWNNLCDENKNFITRNEALSRDNQTLKTDLQATNQENHRLRVYNQQLASEVEDLRRSLSSDGENADRFRRRLADLRAEADKKEKTIQHLEKDNGILNARVRELTRTVSDGAQRISDLAPWRKRCEDLQAVYEDLKRRYEKARRLLAERTADLRESDAIVDEQRNIIRRHHSRPHYAYV